MPTYSEKLKDSLKDSGPIPDTLYDSPAATFTSTSSAVNYGVSKEGGVSALTFKSIGYTDYAEQLELMRDALFPGEAEAQSRIRDRDFQGKELLATLQQEVQQYKNTPAPSKANDIDDTLTEHIANKQPIDSLKGNLFNSYKAERQDKELLVNFPSHITKSIATGEPVETMQDVANLDLTPYQKSYPNVSSSSFPGLDSQSLSLATEDDYPLLLMQQDNQLLH